ncbi:MAG: serine/threonine-protein kinase [Myxococcota bacterium]
MSDNRAARTLVTLGLIEPDAAQRVPATLDGGTWPDVLASMGLAGAQLEEALAVVAAAGGPLGDDAVTSEASGRYVDLEELGRGGMGRVVRTEDAHLHRQVAKKELLVNHPAIELRFLREGRITAQLEHPGIVPVYELGRRADGTLYYTMKEVRGKTLRDALDAAPTLRQRLALLGVFVDLCQAVGYAHSKGVVHRDLKPENVMIGAFGETTVLDWGLAKVAGEPDAALPEGLAVGSGAGSDLTRAGTVMGTPRYMSPEQAAGRSDLDARSDVWSIGIMLYELLTGEVPFDGPTDSVLRLVKDGLFAPVQEIEGKVPPALAAICTKALGHSPAERYDTAAEVAEELEAWRTGATVGAHTYSAIEQVHNAARRFRLVLVGLACLGIGAFAASSVVGGQRDAAVQAASAADARVAYFAEVASAADAEGRGQPAEALARVRHALGRADVPEEDRAVAEALLARVRRAGDLRVLSTEPVHSFRWAPSGGRLAWASGSSVQIVDPDSGSVLGAIPAPGRVTAFAFSPDERLVWVGTEAGDVLAVATLDLSEKVRFAIGGPVELLVPSPEGSSVLAGAPGAYGRWSDSGVRQSLAPALGAAASLVWRGSEPVAGSEGVGPVDAEGAVTWEGERLTPGFVVERAQPDPDGDEIAMSGPGGLAVWEAPTGDRLLSNLRVCPSGRVVPVLPFPRMDDLGVSERSCAE